MSFSKFFIGLVLFGLLLIILAWPMGLYAMAFSLVNGILVFFFLLDLLITPNTSVLSVQRDIDDRLYFKAYNQICFTVQNASSYTLRVQAKDDALRHFLIDDEYDNLEHMIPGKSDAAFSYIVQPAKRGAFGMQHIYLRYHGVLGLCIKYVRIDAPIEWKVYPNVRDVSKYRLMLQKSRLLPQGDKPLRHFGIGAEFESLRTYVVGDDYRKINWPATARENRLIVNQYQIERNQPVCILLDAARPMSYDVGGFKKLDYAINAALILCDIVNQQGDNAGLLVFDAAVQAHMPPGKGAIHRNQLMEILYHVQDNRLTADYEGAFRQLCEKQKRRSLVFIFTDFEILDEAEELIAHITLLKRRHMPIVVFMKNEGLQAMTDASVQSKKEAMLRDTAAEFLAERQQIFKQLNAMGIPNIESTAENFAAAAVNRYISLSKG